MASRNYIDPTTLDLNMVEKFLATYNLKNDHWMNSKGYFCSSDSIIFEPHAACDAAAVKGIKEIMKGLGCAKIRIWNPFGAQTYKGTYFAHVIAFVPTQEFAAKVNEYAAKVAAEKAAKEAAFEAEVNAIDLSEIKNNTKVMTKIQGYMSKGTRINYAAIKDQKKMDTYYAACMILGWTEMAKKMAPWVNKAMKEKVKRVYSC